jgi:hypothetical protein
MAKIGDNKKVGSNIVAATIPTQNAECVSSQAIQPIKKRTIQTANDIKQVDGKYRRNIGSANAELCIISLLSFIFGIWKT